MIDLASGAWPGSGLSEDVGWAAWNAFARRDVSIWRAVGVDGGLAELNDQLLDWIDAQIAHRSRDEEFAALVRRRIDELLEAGRRGRVRGEQLRRHQRPPTPSMDTSPGWLLRHPADHYFRSARDKLAPGSLIDLIDVQIRLLDQSYERLAATYSRAGHAQLVAEVEIAGPVGHGWKEPISAVVLSTVAEEVSVGDRGGLRLVADPMARGFDGTLISVRDGERWLIHADHLSDATLIPRDGSLRLAA